MRLLGPVLALLFACSAGNGQPSAGAAAAPSTRAVTPPPSTARPAPRQPSSEHVPVDADDPVWGSAMAPVTLVVFADLECPYCAEAHHGLIALERHYGEARLRVVLKHLPLRSHAHAVHAARLAQAVLAVSGSRKLFEYVDLAYAEPALVEQGAFAEILHRLALDPELLFERASTDEIGAQVLGDVLLADRLRVPATPHFRVNGLPLTGVQPLESLERIVDRELAATAALARNGVPAKAIYSHRVAANVMRGEP